MIHTLLMHTFLAAAYGEGTYNTSTYSSSGSGGGLVDTGLAIAVVVTLAAVITLVALAVRIWKRPSKATVPESTEQGE